MSERFETKSSEQEPKVYDTNRRGLGSAIGKLTIIELKWTKAEAAQYLKELEISRTIEALESLETDEQRQAFLEVKEWADNL